MNKTELQEKVLLSLLINKHSGEEVNADLIKRVVEEFNSIAEELEPPGKSEMKPVNMERFKRS
jgi:hypothetical protein